jgi:hypothetical protein
MAMVASLLAVSRCFKGGDGDALTGRVKRRWRRSDRTHGEEPLGAGLVRDVRVEMPTDFWICRSMYPIQSDWFGSYGSGYPHPDIMHLVQSKMG